MRRLYMRLVRYCERAEVPYPKMPRRSRRPGRRGGRHTQPDFSLIDGCVAMMKKHPQPMSVEDFAAKVGVDTRIAKRLIAEMRRRRLLADGIVPIKGATTNERLVSSEVFVLEAVREAWNDKDRQCHSLGSLVDYGRYARHTISIAIIKLRKLGLVEARGGLYLREHA
jgi:NMD protein affecting ribosome stability and mRNA decay